MYHEIRSVCQYKTFADSCRNILISPIDIGFGAQTAQAKTPDLVSQRLQSSGMNAAKPILLISLFLCSGNAFAQPDDKETAAVIELGAAANRSLTEGQSSFGPTVAVEVTPIENWLELEAGVTPLFRRHSTEWSIDLLFKKPWTISDRTEFMLGVGPEWIHTNAFGIKRNF